jgi:hypothetical protein
MLGALRGFAAFWVDFIVGEDWRIAAGVALMLLGGAGLVHGELVRTDVVAVGLPIVIVCLVAASILRDGRRLRPEPTSPRDSESSGGA